MHQREDDSPNPSRALARAWLGRIVFALAAAVGLMLALLLAGVSATASPRLLAAAAPAPLVAAAPGAAAPCSAPAPGQSLAAAPAEAECESSPDAAPTHRTVLPVLFAPAGRPPHPLAASPARSAPRLERPPA